MPERRAIQAVTRRVSDCAESWNDKCGWVKPFVDAGVGKCCGSDLVWTRWSAADSIKDRIPEASEVVGDGERAARIPDENRIGLPSRKRHFFGSGKGLAKRQFIGDGANKA